MKTFTKLLLIIVSIATLIPSVVFAAPSSVNRLTNDHIEPMISTDYIKAAFFNTSGAATSTIGDLFYRQDTSCINVLEGDSLTDKAAQPTDWSTYIDGYDKEIGKCRTVNVATTGDTMANINATYAAQVSIYKPIYTSDRRNFFLWACTNDINAGVTGTACYADTKATAQKAKADGFKVIIFTTITRAQFVSTPAKDTERRILNNLILADANTGLYDVIIQPDLMITNSGDASCFIDSAHLTASCGQAVARLVSKSLNYNPWVVLPNSYATTTASDLWVNPGGDVLVGSNLINYVVTSNFTTVATSSSRFGSSFRMVDTASTTQVDIGNTGILYLATGQTIATSTLTATNGLDIGTGNSQTEAIPVYRLGIHDQSATGFQLEIENSGGVSRDARILLKGSISVQNAPFSAGCILSGFGAGTAYSQSYIQITSVSGANTCRTTPDLTAQNNRIGVATTTPYATVSATNVGTNPTVVFEDSTSPDLSPFIIDANGATGIGTTTLNYKFTVDGATTAIFENTTNPLVDVNETASGQNRRLRLQYDTTGSTAQINATTGSGQSPSLVFLVGSTEYARFWGNLNGSGVGNLGNLGIGTTTPQAKTDISTTASTTNLLLESTTANTGGCFITKDTGPGGGYTQWFSVGGLSFTKVATSISTCN